MAIRYSVIVACLAAVLCGASYQQFRHFDTADSRGINDARYYVAMSHGDYSVNPAARYRFVVPALAGSMRALLPASLSNDEADRLAFYVVNFCFSLLAAILLDELLRALGFSALLALLGAALFASSTVTVIVTATPLIDAFYFASIAAILWCAVTDRSWWFLLVLPIAALSKETIFPFMLLPLVTRARRSPEYYLSLLLAIAAVAASRYIIDSSMPASEAGSFAEIVSAHVGDAGANLRSVLTLEGFHDVLLGYSFLAPIALAGMVLGGKSADGRVPAVVWLTLPIAFGISFLSDNFGRIFFSSFPAVIAYALIAVRHTIERSGRSRRARPD
jgi:hypothetical protein